MNSLKSGDKLIVSFRVGMGEKHKLFVASVHIDIVESMRGKAPSKPGWSKTFHEGSWSSEKQSDKYVQAKSVTIPTAIRKLSQAFVTMKWKDQGWGNVKGSCQINLMKGNSVLATAIPFGPVTHKLKIVQY